MGSSPKSPKCLGNPSLFLPLSTSLLQSCFLAEWTLIIWQIKSGPHWSLLYLWEPCLLPVNAPLLSDVSQAAFASSDRDGSVVLWLHFPQQKHWHTRNPPPHQFEPSKQVNCALYLPHFHVWGVWAINVVFHDSLMGITVSRMLAQNGEHGSRNNQINPPTAQSMGEATIST